MKIINLSFWVLLLVLFNLASCNLIKSKSDKDLIVGEWRLVTDSSNSIISDSLWKCLIFTDKHCKVYPGFYRYKSDDWVIQIDYFGNTTSFEIDSQNIKVYNIIKKQWEEFFIKKITNDTLILNSSMNELLVFVKIQKKQKYDNNFDEIILLNESIGKYRTDYKIILSKNSNAQINAYNYNDQYKIHKTCKVENILVDSIFKLFNYVNISELKNEYNPFEGDNFNYESKQKTTIAFIKDNRVIKEVQVIDNSGPLDLHLAYEPIKSIFNLDRSQCETATDNQIHANIISDIYTIDESKYFILSTAEQYLVNLKINNAKEVTYERIKDIYKLKSDFQFIFSDGRFIRKEGNNKIYDVGYSFIDSTKFKLVKKDETDY